MTFINNRNFAAAAGELILCVTTASSNSFCSLATRTFIIFSFCSCSFTTPADWVGAGVIAIAGDFVGAVVGASVWIVTVVAVGVNDGAIDGVRVGDVGLCVGTVVGRGALAGAGAEQNSHRFLVQHKPIL